ncbi:MAG: AI-2E family transporter [Clostridiales bacterium]|nr:AI-2E family transporter [Clostridiales bacterium]
MKINWNEKYTTIAVYTFIVSCSIIIFYLSLSQVNIVFEKFQEAIVILQPFFIGFAIAYLLNFILKFFENKVFQLELFNKINYKIKEVFGIIATYLVSFLLLGLFLKFVLPQLLDSIIGLINDVPYYIDKSSDFLNNVFNKLNIDKEYISLANEKVSGIIDYIITISTELIPVLGNTIKSLVSSLWNVILGIIISIYLLIDRKRFIALSKKLIYGILSKNAANKTIEIASRSNEIFGKFLFGKIIDSFIIGILVFIILSLVNMPYALLISVIVGITNIIPFFGPFIGAIPSFIIIVFANPIKGIWFIIIILIVQQIDGNIIGPKILGNSIGISAFWILFAILVAGKFFGIVGMILGVPMFVVIYSIIKELIENKLHKKGLDVETEKYMK